MTFLNYRLSTVILLALMSITMLPVAKAVGNEEDVDISPTSRSVIQPEAWNRPFNKISQVSCHNCYEPHLFVDEEQNSLPLRDALDTIKAVELDIWDTYDPFALDSGLPRHWYVRHGKPEDFNLNGALGNYSNCTPPGSLQECLEDIRDWSDDNPNHFPITLFIDKKQAWSKEDEGRRPADLFWLLKNVLGKKLYRPRDLFAFNRLVNTSPKILEWPEAKDMAGRIVIVVNGGNFLIDNLTRWLPGTETYNTSLNKLTVFEKTASAFGGPYAFAPEDVDRAPTNISDSNFAVFLNTSYKGQPAKLRQALLQNPHKQLIRMWHVDEEKFCGLVRRGVSYAAYYDFRKAHCRTYQIMPARTILNTEPPTGQPGIPLPER